MSRPKKTPNPDHALLIERWCEEFEKRFGTKYVFQGGKDGVAVKRLLEAGITPDKAISTAMAAWSKPVGRNTWNCNTQSSRLHQLAAAFSAIVVELENSAPKIRDYSKF